jgi:hypothetical protein
VELSAQDRFRIKQTNKDREIFESFANGTISYRQLLKSLGYSRRIIRACAPNIEVNISTLDTLKIFPPNFLERAHRAALPELDLTLSFCHMSSESDEALRFQSVRRYVHQLSLEELGTFYGGHLQARNPLLPNSTVVTDAVVAELNSRGILNVMRGGSLRFFVDQASRALHAVRKDDLDWPVIEELMKSISVYVQDPIDRKALSGNVIGPMSKDNQARLRHHVQYVFSEIASERMGPNYQPHPLAAQFDQTLYDHCLAYLSENLKNYMRYAPGRLNEALRNFSVALDVPLGKLGLVQTETIFQAVLFARALHYAEVSIASRDMHLGELVSSLMASGLASDLAFVQFFDALCDATTSVQRQYSSFELVRALDGDIYENGIRTSVDVAIARHPDVYRLLGPEIFDAHQSHLTRNRALSLPLEVEALQDDFLTAALLRKGYDGWSGDFVRRASQHPGVLTLPLVIDLQTRAVSAERLSMPGAVEHVVSNEILRQFSDQLEAAIARIESDPTSVEHDVRRLYRGDLHVEKRVTVATTPELYRSRVRDSLDNLFDVAGISHSQTKPPERGLS